MTTWPEKSLFSFYSHLNSKSRSIRTAYFQHIYGVQHIQNRKKSGIPDHITFKGDTSRFNTAGFGGFNIHRYCVSFGYSTYKLVLVASEINVDSQTSTIKNGGHRRKYGNIFTNELRSLWTNLITSLQKSGKTIVMKCF